MNNQVQLVFIAVILYSSLSINHEVVAVLNFDDTTNATVEFDSSFVINYGFQNVPEGNTPSFPLIVTIKNPIHSFSFPTHLWTSSFNMSGLYKINEYNGLMTQFECLEYSINPIKNLEPVQLVLWNIKVCQIYGRSTSTSENTTVQCIENSQCAVIYKIDANRNRSRLSTNLRMLSLFYTNIFCNEYIKNDIYSIPYEISFYYNSSNNIPVNAFFSGNIKTRNCSSLTATDESFFKTSFRINKVAEENSAELSWYSSKSPARYKLFYSLNESLFEYDKDLNADLNNNYIFELYPYYDYKNLKKLNSNYFNIQECFKDCISLEECQRIVILEKECYYYDVYDPFYQIECKRDSNCFGSYEIKNQAQSTILKNLKKDTKYFFYLLQTYERIYEIQTSVISYDTTKVPSTKTGVILAIVIPVILFAICIVIVLVLVFIYRKKNPKRPNISLNPINTAHSQGVYVNPESNYYNIDSEQSAYAN